MDLAGRMLQLNSFVQDCVQFFKAPDPLADIMPVDTSVDVQPFIIVCIMSVMFLIILWYYFKHRYEKSYFT
jgi:hypothetical protein